MLVAYYPFDGDGRDHSSSGGGNPVNVDSTAIITTGTGKVGGCLEIGQTGHGWAYASPGIQFEDEFAVMFWAWVEPTMRGRELPLVELYEDKLSKVGWTILVLLDGSLRLDGRGGCGVTQGEVLGGHYSLDSYAWVDGWNHIGVTRRFTDSTKRGLDSLLYLNGKLAGTRWNEDDRLDKTDGVPLRIGKAVRHISKDKATGVWKTHEYVFHGGRIDELYFYRSSVPDELFRARAEA